MTDVFLFTWSIFNYLLDVREANGYTYFFLLSCLGSINEVAFIKYPNCYPREQQRKKRYFGNTNAYK